MLKLFNCAFLYLEDGITYLKLQSRFFGCSEVDICSISFNVKGMILTSIWSVSSCFLLLAEKRVVHSQAEHLLGKKPAVLCVISPNHGDVEYVWEKAVSSTI